MSSIPQVSPGMDSSRQTAGKNTKYPGSLPASLPVVKSRILMIGQKSSWGFPLQSALQALGCEFSFAATLRVSNEFLRKKHYDVLLLDSSVPPSLRRKLAEALAASEASIFQLFPVENDCWWLPVLRKGEYCFGAPGYRTKEFPAELARLLEIAE